jgi:hypothetical protein
MDMIGYFVLLRVQEYFHEMRFGDFQKYGHDLALKEIHKIVDNNYEECVCYWQDFKGEPIGRIKTKSSS